MLTQEQFTSDQSLGKTLEAIVTKVDDSSAVKLALDTRCSESEESSDDSYSSDGSLDGEDEEPALTLEMSPPAPRRPTSLSIGSLSDRRASAPSQRSPLSISGSRSLSTACSIPSPRTPSVSMRHNAALRSFQQRRDQEILSSTRAAKTRPAMMVDIASIPKAAAPRIEIVQVYDDGKEESVRQQEDSAKADRSAARKRMMSTLGRGQTKAASTLPQGNECRRVPSLDQISNLFQAREDEGVKTPTPKTPGTTSPFHRQRNVSCPTPTSPHMHAYGEVQVIVTPPTPRLQGSGSPVCVQLSGFQRGNSVHGHVRSYSSDDASLLAPPAFELAPGKQKAMEKQRTQAIAWLTSWQVQQEQMEQFHQQQQQMLLASMQHALPHCFEMMTRGMFSPCGMQNAGSVTLESPSIVPGTPGAPSMIHIQQQRAIIAQQQQLIMQASPTTRATSPPSKSSASAKSSWWRGPQSGTSSTASASSCSVYSKSSGAYSAGSNTAADFSSSSSTSSSPQWRRKAAGIESPELVRSAGAVYMPPGKRASLHQKQRQPLR